MNTIVLTTVILLVVPAFGDADRSCPESCTCDDLNENLTCYDKPIVLGFRPRMLTLKKTNLVLSIDTPWDSNLKDLKILNFVESDLVLVDQHSLDSFPRLDHVSIENSKVQIDFDVFRSLENLETLYLYNNTLNLTNNNIRLNQISEFIVRRNSWSSDVVYELKSADYISLEHVNMSAITPLSKVPLLEALSLTGNHIKQFSNEPFGQNSNIFHIDVSNNDLSNTKGLGISSLQQLNISRNKIEILPSDSFENMESVVWIDLSYNPIQEINSKSFQHLKSLENIYMSHCDLKQISFDIFPNRLMQGIDLSFNRIDTIETPKIQFIDMKRLLLQNNRISIIPPGFFTKFKTLIILDLSENLFENLDQESWNLNRLIKLNLSNNNLTNIDALLTNNNIQKLYLSNNQIENVGDLSRLQFLHLIDLSCNEIENIPNIPHFLKYLNLANNNIVNINKTNINKLTYLNGFNILNNPLACEKSFLDLLEIFKKTGTVCDYGESRQDYKIGDEVEEIKIIRQTWDDLKKEVCKDEDELLAIELKTEDQTEMVRTSEREEMEISTSRNIELPEYEDEQFVEEKDIYEKIEENNNKVQVLEDIDPDNESVMINISPRFVKTELKWLTLVLLLLALIITLVLLQVVIIMWRKHRAVVNHGQNTNMPYKQLHNEVYKSTTVQVREEETASSPTQLGKIFKPEKLQNILSNIGSTENKYKVVHNDLNPDA